jgi:acyl-CoA thioester hydrolase
MSDFTLMHSMQIPIRWNDIDAFGHVNNAVYFTYMEIVRFEWIRGVAGALPSGQGPVVAHTECNFLRQITFPGEVEMKVFAGTPGRSSVATRYEFRRVGEPDVLLADGTARLVWIDFAAQKSVPLPGPIRALLPPPVPALT